MKLAIVGGGVMGKRVRDIAKNHERIESVTVVDPVLGESLFQIEKPDMIIDFSHPAALQGICQYALAMKGETGVVFATTGFSGNDEKHIFALSKSVPVIKSSNYSYGVNTMKRILQTAIPLLAQRSDIEIIEKHHNCKVDAPSGTALMLAEICDPQREKAWICGRQGEEKRGEEIGFHSIRGGTIFGEHTVMFAMGDEVIELKHTAFSKDIFAKGAVEAALWLQGKTPGLYALEEVFFLHH